VRLPKVKPLSDAGRAEPIVLSKTWKIDDSTVSNSYTLHRASREVLDVVFQVNYDRQYVDKHLWASPVLPHDIWLDVPSHLDCEMTELIAHEESSLVRSDGLDGAVKFEQTNVLFPHQGFEWRIFRKDSEERSVNSGSRLAMSSISLRERPSGATVKESHKDRVRILFLCANPSSSKRASLALDNEAHEIEKKLRNTERRDRIQFITKWAVRPADLLDILNEQRPQIVHFSGHGSEAAEIILQDDQRRPKPIGKGALVSLFRSMKGNIRLVFRLIAQSSG